MTTRRRSGISHTLMKSALLDSTDKAVKIANMKPADATHQTESGGLQPLATPIRLLEALILYAGSHT